MAKKQIGKLKGYWIPVAAGQTMGPVRIVSSRAFVPPDAVTPVMETGRSPKPRRRKRAA